jgi:hypothetical protein
LFINALVEEIVEIPLSPGAATACLSEFAFELIILPG